MRGALAAVIAAMIAAQAWAGHGGIEVDPVIGRFAGSVTALGEPADDGHVYVLETAAGDLDPDELRSWRLTVISGERQGATFVVAGNTHTELRVTELDGPLDGLAPGDLFLVEQVMTRRMPSRR